MNNSQDGSITRWISDLKDGDTAAAEMLWGRYFEQLVRVASRRLGKAARRVADEEDVAISAFEALCRGAQAGRFERLQDRGDLWALLVSIAGNKAASQVRHQTSQKRGGTELRGESIFRNDDGHFDQMFNSEPTPEMLATIQEEHQRLLGCLQDDVQRTIAELRLEGFSNEEIAQKTGISLRSVVRKLGVIRAIWEREAIG